jgi:hypothetical protein
MRASAIIDSVIRARMKVAAVFTGIRLAMKLGVLVLSTGAVLVLKSFAVH